MDSFILPALGHVGLVVWDVEQYAAYLAGVLGIHDFDIYDFNALTARVAGEEIENFRLKIGIGCISGGVQIELIEPVADGGFFREHLKIHGNGFNHLAFRVEDLEKWRSNLEKKSLPIVFEATVFDEIRGERRIFYTKMNGLNYYYEFAQVV